jgi:predicted ester cyclase
MTSTRCMDTFGNQTSFLANHELHEGREAVRAFYGECFRGFPDLRVDLTPLHVGEEAIPVETVLSGTHTGTWFGIPPTGRRVEIPACAVFIFDEHDKIAGERGDFDSALMLRQLGLLPPS